MNVVNNRIRLSILTPGRRVRVPAQVCAVLLSESRDIGRESLPVAANEILDPHPSVREENFVDEINRRGSAFDVEEYRSDLRFCEGWIRPHGAGAGI